MESIAADAADSIASHLVECVFGSEDYRARLFLPK
jgi:hypothetical protein